MDPGTRLHFCVRCATAFGEEVGVAGDCIQLGQWDTARCFRLKWTAVGWMGALDLDASGGSFARALLVELTIACVLS